MKIGATYPTVEMGGNPRAAKDFALGLEKSGAHHFTVFDHVVGAAATPDRNAFWPYTECDPFHDPFTLFSHLSAVTKTIEFVTGILILPQRQTVLVAKQCTDVDLFSDGRVRLGVGTGWNKVEYDALGQDFTKRGERLDEQIPYLRRLWSEPLLNYEGKFDRIDRAALNIRPSRQIPIWLGGKVDAAFRRAASLGDGFVFANQDIEDSLGNLARLRSFLDEAGRGTDTFGTDVIHPVKDVQETLSALNRWREAGGTHFTLNTVGLGLDGVEGHLDLVNRILERA